MNQSRQWPSAEPQHRPSVNQQASGTVQSRQSVIQKRDDLVGAIMRYRGDGIAAHMALTVAGDTANNLPKIRGLFTNKGTADLGDVAMFCAKRKVTTFVMVNIFPR